MATNGKFLGKDGQWYDTAQEMWSANSAWNEKQGIQKEQNRLIQQQNQLLQQQNELNYQIEQEKIQKNYELEMNKLQHEEKMRILKLFDEIGISKETYDNYINNNILNKETEKLQAKRDKHLLMSSKYDFLLHEDEHYEELEYDAYDSTMEKYDLYDLKAELMDDQCYDKVNKAKQKEKEDLIIKAKRAKRWLVGSSISAPISLALFIAICEGPEFAVYTMMILMICIATTLFVSGCIWSQTEKQINEMPDKIFNVNKYHNKLKVLIGHEVETANKLTETIKNNNMKQIDVLYNFRLNHYNSSIEKLLVDVGFKELIEDLGLEYRKVNNSNKKKDGTIDDYIEYFETNS